MAKERGLLVDLFYLFAGCAITLGFWLAPDIARWLEERDAVPVAQPAPREAPQPAPAVIPDATPMPRSESGAGRRALELERERETLQRMTQTCAFWSARDDDDAGRTFRDAACDSMRDYARATRQPVPRITVERTPAAKPRSAPQRAIGVAVRECTQHVRGSIAYRECRASEKQRLKQRCQQHRQREEWREASPWCAAADSYRIID